MRFSATYSPEDNKLRLYSLSRLDPETYGRVKEKGFIWAPKQDLFVAPAWTPERVDFLLELCGEIGDEDTSLVERAEARSERFEGYSEHRAKDADSARRAMAVIANGIPLGQPILVGHHSERHARKDAERIRNGMGRAVRMWETSKYWERRAAGAIHLAKYKELPGVRARRIKGLEADRRKKERERDEAQKYLNAWSLGGLTLQQARYLANVCWLYVCKNDGTASHWSAWDVLRPEDERYEACPTFTVEQVVEVAQRIYPELVARAQRWIDHLSHRITYEKAMLEEAGGLKGAGFAYEVGGQVLRRGQWFIITKINQSGGVVNSVSVLGHFASTVTLDEIKDYRAPQDGDAEKIKAKTALPPLCNYPGEGFLHMTKAEYEKGVPKWSDFGKIATVKATESTGPHRARRTLDPQRKNSWDCAFVFLIDAKRTDPPALALEAPAPILLPHPPEPRAPRVEAAPDPSAGGFEGLKESLRAGVQVVTAGQLFPTPHALALRMVDLADIEPGHEVLEPSAGTGRILEAVHSTAPLANLCAIEVNASLARALVGRFGAPGEQTEGVCSRILEADFLGCKASTLGCFDRVVMNPPFGNGADIQHIQHALTLLKPGGRLVAICANGPRQHEHLKPLVEAHGGTWEVLPPNTFQNSGTGVNTVLLSLNVA